MSNNYVTYNHGNHNFLNTGNKQKDFNFDKIVSEVSNYLFVPENSLELQYLYMIGERYDERKRENIQQFSKEVEEYDNIIKIAAEFIRDLGLQDNYTSYYVIFTYLLWNGFFSKDMKYIFTNNNLLSLNGFQGFDVIAGKGSCRSISNILNSISQQLGFDTHFLVNSFRTNYRNHILDIERKDEHGIILPPKLHNVSYNTSINSVGDHASILLNQNGNFYVYDPTNLSVYKVDETLIANLYNGVGECHIKPWGFIMYENMKQFDILELLCSIKSQNQFSFISNSEIREIIDESLDTCRKSKSLMLDFYSQIQNNIGTINESIFHK